MRWRTMNKKRATSLLALPYGVYALIFIVAPLLLIVLYSFCVDPKRGMELTFEHFRMFFDFRNPVYLRVLWRSLYIAFISTVICLLLGYPMALILSRLRPRVRSILSVLFVLPMWMNFLLRTYSWMSLLEKTGLINSALKALGLAPWNIMYTQWAVVLGSVYNFLPFMILPIYNVMVKIDNNLIEAAYDLGASGKTVLTKVLLPLSMPGIISGITMVFVPAVTTFVISQILGGGKIYLIGNIIEQEFTLNGNRQLGSGLSLVMMVFILISMALLNKFDKNGEGSII